MFTYRLHLTDGVTLAKRPIRSGSKSASCCSSAAVGATGSSTVVLFDEQDESPFVGLLQVEAA